MLPDFLYDRPSSQSLDILLRRKIVTAQALSSYDYTPKALECGCLNVLWYRHW